MMIKKISKIANHNNLGETFQTQLLLKTYEKLSLAKEI